MPFLNNIGSAELFIIALALFFLFGGKKLHEWARGIGEAGREVKKVKKEFEDGFEGPIEDPAIDPIEKPSKVRKGRKIKEQKEVD